MVILDKKDRKLIYYLSINARTSHTQLSQKIGLSKNAVKYRVNRLFKEGIIHHFSSVVNIGAIKADTFTILLKFNEDIYDRREIIDFFKNHDFSIWAVTLSGQWDIFVEMVCTSLYHISDLVKGITDHFGGILNTYKVYFSGDTLRVEHLVEDFYKDLNVEPLPRKKRVKALYDLDKTDRRILHLLCEDSSLQFLTIGKKLGISIDIVRYRIKSLTDKGILIKTFPEVFLPGYTEYLFVLNLKNVSQDKMYELRKMIQNHPNVTYAFIDITSFNLVFTCSFKSVDEIDHLSRSLRKGYGEIIDSQEYLIIKEQILFNLFPRGLL